MKSSFRNNSGFSLIETLVSITIFGILLSLSIAMFTRLNTNPAVWYKSKALVYAKQEIRKIRQLNIIKDTSFVLPNKSLKLIREVKDENNMYNICIKVVHKDSLLLAELMMRKRK